MLFVDDHEKRGYSLEASTPTLRSWRVRLQRASAELQIPLMQSLVVGVLGEAYQAGDEVAL